MKRRVANLPPVKADIFNQKVLQQRKAAGMMLPSGNGNGESSAANVDQDAPEDDGLGKKDNENRCDLCR